MNDLLHLKGIFERYKNPSRPGAPTLSTNYSVYIKHLNELLDNLKEILNFYSKNVYKIVNDCFVSIYYNKVAAKSNRTKAFFNSGKRDSNETIVGAKFSKEGNHIITHYIPLESIYNAIKDLEFTIEIAKQHFKNPITHIEFNDPNFFKRIKFYNKEISKSKFQQVIADCSYIEKFDIEKATYTNTNDVVVTFYKTELEATEILKQLNIKFSDANVIDKTTIILTKNEIDKLLSNAPYLVSMLFIDLSKLSPDEFKKTDKSNDFKIKDPSNEPVIGVIDTHFDTSVYFNKWVEYHNELSEEIEIKPKDKEHGTRVTSIIVDGPKLNPKLDDGCGNFRVRHFGVATAGRFSSVSVMKSIQRIVSNNPDIKIWNISLGSNAEINRNFISVEAATLDQLQFEKDIIFVISGTNDAYNLNRKIGSPADSINSLVVNSVDFNNQAADYSRIGPVLDFFTKPDVSYYGGTLENPIMVYGTTGVNKGYGTSLAAPWIARKLAYMIEILGLTREVAKGLIIDSAIGWNNVRRPLIGHGIVPIKINDIVQSPNDEIKFIITNSASSYQTVNYNFPIPFHMEEYPFVTKATLCYFPKCNRNQGVDYTNTELDIYFGRINNKDKISSINKNKQSSDEGPVTEETSRREFGKWDNIKHLQDEYRLNPRGKKVYDSKLWGMKVVSKDRLGNNDGLGIKFSVIVTLKEINGLNRINEFVSLFNLRGWIVNRINVDNRIDIYQKSEETIKFD